MAETTKSWLQLRLAYASSMLDEAHSLLSQASARGTQMLALRAAFCSGACLLFSTQRVPSLDSPVPDESEPLAEAPDLSLGHELLGVNELRATTESLKAWDDWGSYQPGESVPVTLDEAVAWAQQIQAAFERRYGLN